MISHIEMQITTHQVAAISSYFRATPSGKVWLLWCQSLKLFSKSVDKPLGVPPNQLRSLVHQQSAPSAKSAAALGRSPKSPSKWEGMQGGEPDATAESPKHRGSVHSPLRPSL